MPEQNRSHCAVLEAGGLTCDCHLLRTFPEVRGISFTKLSLCAIQSGAGCLYHPVGCSGCLKARSRCPGSKHVELGKL